MVEGPLVRSYNEFSHSNRKDINPWKHFRSKKTVVDLPAVKDEPVKPAEKPLVTSFIPHKLSNEQPTYGTAIVDSTSTGQEDAGLQNLRRLGISDVRIQQIQEADTNEKNRSTLATITSLLAKQAKAINRLKEELLKAVEQRYEAFIGYPHHDDFGKFNKDAVEWAKQKDKTTRLRNEALAFIADDTEEYNITKTSEFQKLMRLFSKKGINTKSCLNDTERYLKSLPRLSMEINALRSPVNSEARKKIDNHIRGCTKQIEIAHQREIDLEEQLTAYEKIEKKLKLYTVDADKYHAPAVRDTAQQAMERAEQAKQRREQARQRAKQAAIRLEEAISRHSLNIDPNLSASSAIVVEHARKVVKLEYQCALQADNIFNFASNKAAELEKDPEKYTIDDDKSIIKAEQDMLKKEKELLTSLKEFKTDEVKTLEQEKRVFSEYQIKSATENEDIDENKDKRQAEQILSLKKAIDKAIKYINSNKISEVQENLKECDTINIQYKAFDPKGKRKVIGDEISIKQDLNGNIENIEIEKISIEAYKATSLAEQYKKRAKQTRDRVKEYKQQAKLLNACDPTRSFSQAISIAEEIAKNEQNISHAYLTIAQNADTIAKLYNSNSNDKQEEIERCKRKIRSAEEDKENCTLKIQNLHKREIKSINSHKEVVKASLQSTRMAQEHLTKLQEDLSAVLRGEKDISGDTKKMFTNNTLKDILKYNISYVKYKMSNDRKNAIEYLDAINDTLLKGKDAQDIIDRSEAHVVFYKKWMVFNGCLVYANDFRYLTVDKEAGTVTATWREEMPEITIFGNKKYTRRISEIYINSDNRTISFKIPGNVYKNGERGEISINDSGPKNIDKDDKSVVIKGDQDFESIIIKKQGKENTSDVTLEEAADGSTNATSSQASKGSDHTPMMPNKLKTKTVKSVQVERHEKEQGGIELSSCIEIKTLPDSNMSLDNKFSSLTREQIQGATRINFDASGRMTMYASGNTFSIPLDRIDLDETRVDENLTTTHEQEAVFQTGVTYHRLALSEIGRMSNFISDITYLKEKTNMQKRKLAIDFIDNLKSAVNTLDEDIITSLLQSTQTISSRMQAKTASIKDRLREPPKSAQDFERMHSSLDDTLPNDTLERMLQTYKDDIQDMYTGNNDLSQALKQKIIGQIDKSSKAKEDLLDEINAAYCLNESFQFNLLVDPNRGGEIKCSNPDALMLVEEYEMYTNRSLTPHEEHYKRSIEEFIGEIDNIYLKNAIYIRKAEEFANSDNNGDKLNNLVKALKNINRGDHPDISSDPNSLEYLRQNAEYHWAKFTDKALSIAKDAGIDELALGLVHEATQVERSRLKTLKLAQYALNPETPTDLAKRAIENDPIDTPALSTELAKKDLQDADKKLDNVELEVDQLIQEGLKNKNPAEYAKKSLGLAWKLAAIKFQAQLKVIDNPAIKKDFEARAVEIQEKMANQALSEFKVIMGLSHYNDQKKLMSKMMKHELLVVLVTNGNIQLRQFQNRIGNVFQRLIADLFKILGVSKG